MILQAVQLEEDKVCLRPLLSTQPATVVFRLSCCCFPPWTVQSAGTLQDRRFTVHSVCARCWKMTSIFTWVICRLAPEVSVDPCWETSPHSCVSARLIYRGKHKMKNCVISDFPPSGARMYRTRFLMFPVCYVRIWYPIIYTVSSCFYSRTVYQLPACKPVDLLAAHHCCIFSSPLHMHFNLILFWSASMGNCYTLNIVHIKYKHSWRVMWKRDEPEYKYEFGKAQKQRFLLSEYFRYSSEGPTTVKRRNGPVDVGDSPRDLKLNNKIRYVTFMLRLCKFRNTHVCTWFSGSSHAGLRCRQSFRFRPVTLAGSLTVSSCVCVTYSQICCVTSGRPFYIFDWFYLAA